MIEQYTSPAVVNNSQEPWLVGEGVSLSGSIAIPSLDFNFVTNAFPGTVTFTRASSATMFDSSGTLVYAPMNAIRNSSASGASAPSTLPTNWGAVQNGGTGVTSTVATGTEDGISYLDINISGTPSGSGSYQITFEPPATISALNGQTWTNSAFLKLSAGSFTNVGAIRFTTAEWTSAPAFIQNNQSVLPFPTNAALSTQRAAASVTLSGGTTASIVPSITLTITAGQAISLTLRIGLPQLEQGAFATSIIPTTTTALTRSADVAAVNTLSPWYNATEGTLFSQASLISSSYSGGVLLDIGAGGAFGTTEYIAWNGTAWTLNPNIAPLNVISTVTTVSTAKVAAGLKVNDSVISANSLIGVTDTSCGIASSPTTLSIGKGGWLGSANYFNGWIRRITYYPRRLSNAELVSITS